MTIRTLSPVLAALTLLASAACGGGDATRLIAPDGKPSLVGQTASVTVSCPNRIKPGQTAQCTAFGYDNQSQFTSSTVSSWSSSNTGKITVTSGGAITGQATGTATIYATIDGITGSKVVTVEPDIYIDGPGSVRSGHVCSFFGEVTAGTAPYSYSWSNSSNWTHDTGWTDGEPATWTGHSTSGSSFSITLTVTDASGISSTVSKSVSISSTAPSPCFI
jgi:hypothetical protein